MYPDRSIAISKLCEINNLTISSSDKLSKSKNLNELSIILFLLFHLFLKMNKNKFQISIYLYLKRDLGPDEILHDL